MMKGSSQDNFFSVEVHLEADVLGHCIQTSEKGPSISAIKKKMGCMIGLGNGFTE